MGRKMWKRAVSFLMAALMTVASVPAQALAEGEARADNGAVDWENIIDDCEIQVLEGGTNEKDGKRIEYLRDGNPDTLWVRNGYGGGDTSLLKFTFPIERTLKKVKMYFEDNDYETTVILLDADQNEIGGTRNTVKRRDGYEWNFASETVAKEFYVKFEESPWALIGEMQIFAERDAGENIAGDCKITAPDSESGYPLSNMTDGNPKSEWRKNGNIANASATLHFALPAARKVKKVALKFFASDGDLSGFPTRNLMIELQRDGSAIADSKRQTVVNQTEEGGYEYVFSSAEEMDGFDIVLSEPRNTWDGSPDAGFYPSIAEAEIYAERDGGQMENIAKDCVPETAAGDKWGRLEQINDEDVDTNWTAEADKFPATVKFSIPDDKEIRKIVCKLNRSSDVAGKMMDIKLEYATDDNEHKKLISEKEKQQTGGDYEVIFSTLRTDMKYLYMTVSNPMNADGTGTSFCPAMAEVEIYAEKSSVLAESVQITSKDGGTVADGATLEKGKTLELAAAVLPENADNKDVTWSSSDENVATVSEDGLVTGVEKGEVTITATAADGSGVQGTCKLTVKGIPITGITLNPAVLTMDLGDSQKIEAVVAPENASEKSVTWESDDTNVATVEEDGTVTAVGAGTAVITATGRTETEIKQTANVTVRKPDIQTTKITVSGKEGRHELAVSETMALTATVEPEGAAQAVAWISDNDDIATVNENGFVKAIKEGTVQVTAMAKDGSGVTGTISLTVRKGQEAKIDLSKCALSAKNANGHGIGLAADGKADTHWQSIPSGGEGNDKMKNRMYDHNRYIDIALDGTYDLTEIKIFNKLDGSFNNYYVYASEDGKNYDKIISKTSNDAATAAGDSYKVNKTAAYLRLNMAYNSDSFVTNLAEIEVKGAKVSDTVPESVPISVEDWEGGEWQVEWDKFEANENGYADQKVLNEMGNLVGRVLGSKWKSSFRFELRDSLEEGKDIFEIKDGENNTIVIRGNGGIAMASGFNYYLKNFANIDYSPMYSSNVELDKIKPVGKKIVKEAQFDLRYALNFCTYSYTMSFWNWDEYEAFLDWAAMNGINLVLDIVGQEEVLRQTFAEFGYTDEEVKDYISGPAYFAWFYMQNLYSIGGPLPDSWFEGRVELGRQIHDRMQTYGIDPVIQAFAGQVPDTFVEKNKGSVFTPECEWSGFTRPSILKTYLTEEETAAGKVDYFQRVADVFYEKQKNVFGNVSHYYAADPFHEGGLTGDEMDLSEIYKAVQVKMLEKDPEAIWVMQQWQGNLNAWKMSKLDTKKTLPLDLQANMKKENSYFEKNGSSWIYCMLHNFGGRMGLDGDIPKMASDPIETFQKSKNMVGIGMSPEAMENSPVVYELLFDLTWSKDPIDYKEWTKKYGERRAGGTSESLNEAWKILLETAYAAKDAYYQGAAETVINARPSDSFNAASTWGHSGIYYDKKELDKALLLLVENYEEFAKSPAYKYDLADVAEQVLCNAAVEYHSLMVQAKNAGNLEEFTKLSTAFLGLIDLSDKILATTDGFLLGTWIEAARKMITGADDWTKDLFEFNARSLITTWGGERVGALKDYSNRKWAGLTGSFYKERWAIWIRNRIAELKKQAKDPADEKAEKNWFLWEYQWVNRKSDDGNGKYAFAAEPTDDDLGVLAQQAFEQYSYTNLEKNTGQTAQEIVNVAEGKPVSVGGSQTAEGDPANLTDGNTSTGWKAQGAGPHTMTVDLQEMRQISGLVISIEQIAKDYPYTWEAEYYDLEKLEWVSLGTNRNDENPIMISTTEITKSFAASQIRLTVTTSDLVDSPVYVTEIAVNGVKEEEEKDKFDNLALGLTPTSNRESSADTSLANLTDGDVSNLWKTKGNDYPVDIDLNLAQDSYVDNIEVYFEMADLPFQFYVSVTDLDEETSEYLTEYKNADKALPAKSFKADVKKNVKSVRVSLTGNDGQGPHSGFWPALAEIKVMGAPITTEKDLSDHPVSGITVSGGGATNKVLRDNKLKDTDDKSAYDKLTLGEEVVFDLDQTHYLSHVNLVFEKVGLALKYEIYAEDESGNRKLLEQYDSPARQLLTDRIICVPVGRDAKKIIFVHHGNGTSEESPNAYLAEPRFYGFEAYGVAKSSASAGKAEGMSGAEGDYQAQAGASVTVTLDSPAEVNMIRVSRAEGETKALSYMAEYYDAEKEEWKQFADKTERQDAEESESFAIPLKGAFTGKIRLTFTEDIRIKDISVYNTDLLLSRIVQIENILTELKYDGTHGSYKTEAKEKLEGILAEAKEVTGASVSVINEWIDKVNRALEEFYETGELYVDRSDLLAVMASIKDMIATYDPQGQDLADLQKAYEEARAVYNQYDAPQTEISQNASEGRNQLAILGAKLAAAKDPELAAARADLKNYLNGLEEKDPQEYTRESWNNYMEALAVAEAVVLDWNVTSAMMNLTKERLEAALAGLKQIILVTKIEVSAKDGKTTLEEGQTAQLIVAVTPEDASDQSLKWSSGDKGIATVDENGLVTAHKEGTVEITATAKDGSGVSGKISLTVTKKSGGEEPEDPKEPEDPNPPVLVTEIAVSAKDGKTTLQEGETVQLFVTVTPEDVDNQDVTWSSEDEEIAGVSESGLVTAKAEGTVKITATAKDGSGIFGKISLTVTKKSGGEEPEDPKEPEDPNPPVLVTEIAVSAKDGKTTLQEGETVQLSVTVTPKNADNQDVTWRSGNMEVATVDANGLVTAHKEGTVEITATAKDGSHVSGAITLTVIKKAGGEDPEDPEDPKKPVEIAKQELDDTVAEAEKLTDSSKYTKESWNALQAALEQAKKIKEDPNSTKEQLELAAKAVNDALEKLRPSVKLPPAKVSVQTISLRAAKTTLEEGESLVIAATVAPSNAANKGLTWTSKNTAAATVDQNGKVTAKAAGAVTITATAKDGSRKSGSIEFAVLPKKGKTYRDKKLVYKITASTETEKTVTVQKPVKSSDKKIAIPDSITIGGHEYLVTAIAAKAFRNKKKLQQLVIGANVKTIGKQAFYNCKKLKTVTIKSKKITKTDKQSFSKISNKAKITVPKEKYKAYKKLLQKKAKIAKTVKIIKAKK